MELTATKYKQTEVGMIPEDWELVAFDKIFGFHSTSNYSKAQMSEDDDVGCIHYGLIHAIPNTQYDLANGIKYYISLTQANYEYVRDGDVIMVDASEDLDGVNKSVEVFGIGDKKFISGLHTYLIRDKNSSLADNFRGILLNSSLVKNQMLQLAVGMKVFGVSKTQLVNVLLPLPPKQEQKAIAQVLSDTDALIQALEKKIAKKKLIKKGVMQELLTPKEDWEEAKIEDLIYSFQNGYGFNASGYEKNGVPIVTMAQIGLDGSFQFDERKVNYWRQEDFNSLKSYHLNNGDVIIAMTDVTPDKNLIGRMTIVETKRTLLLNQRVGLLRINRDLINPLFLTTISNMSSWRSYCIGSASLGVQANIGTKDILNGNIMIPEIEEQNKIAQILSDMEKEIMNLKEKLSKYQITKQGMMQQLLTGKIRLV